MCRVLDTDECRASHVVRADKDDYCATPAANRSVPAAARCAARWKGRAPRGEADEEGGAPR